MCVGAESGAKRGGGGRGRGRKPPPPAASDSLSPSLSLDAPLPAGDELWPAEWKSCVVGTRIAARSTSTAAAAAVAVMDSVAPAGSSAGGSAGASAAPSRDAQIDAWHALSYAAANGGGGSAGPGSAFPAGCGALFLARNVVDCRAAQRSALSALWARTLGCDVGSGESERESGESVGRFDRVSTAQAIAKAVAEVSASARSAPLLRSASLCSALLCSLVRRY